MRCHARPLPLPTAPRDQSIHRPYSSRGMAVPAGSDGCDRFGRRRSTAGSVPDLTKSALAATSGSVACVPVADSAFRPSLPVPAGGQGPGLVHAPGGTLAARVPGGAGHREHPRRHPPTRARRRADPAARASLRASTPPSSSPTSWCRSRPWASASTSARAGGRSSTEPFRGPRRPGPAPAPRARGRHRLRARERSASSPASSTPSGSRSSASPAHRSRWPATSSKAGPPASTPTPRRSCAAIPASGPASSTPWPTWPWPRCAPRWPPGASAVQLFDSWVGALSPADYERHVLPATRKVSRAGLADLGRAPHPLRRRDRRAARL